MALYFGAPPQAGSLRRPKKKGKKHPQQRGALPSLSGKRLSKPKGPSNGPRGDRWPKGQEKVFKLCANCAGIEAEYEPTELETGLEGRRMMHIRPDYYLPEYNIYFELTTGDPYYKILKIEGAMKEAAKAGEPIEIVLLNAQNLRDLSSGVSSIWDFLDPAVERLAAKTFDQIAAA